jgi:hypothetical protein
LDHGPFDVPIGPVHAKSLFGCAVTKAQNSSGRVY